MTTATDMLAKYLAAESALLEGKVTRMDDRLLQMEDLAEIRKGRIEWEKRVSAESMRAARAPTIGGLSYSIARMDK